MSIVSYKCPSCGGGLKFKPGKGFKCEYCLSVFTQEQLDEFYKNAAPEESEQPSPAAEAKPAKNASDADGEAYVYSCPSCGAQVITDSTTAATNCHYCHNPIVLSDKLSGSFKPDTVIPFNVTKEQAAESFKQLCAGKFFLPKDFYSEKQIENLYGVYYPYWVVDSQVDASLTATGEKDRSIRVGDDRHTATTHFEVRRDGRITLNDITNAATDKEDSAILQYILPFDVNKAEDFSMTYLSGFRAEKRSLEKSDLSGKVEETKREYSRRLLENDIGSYDRLIGKNLSMRTISDSWSYALLPVWIITYKYLDETFIYGVNGQTGKSFGRLPVDKKKLTLFSVIAAVAGALIAFLIFMAFGG